MFDNEGSQLDHPSETKAAAAAVMNDNKELSKYFLSASSPGEVVQRIQEKQGEVFRFLASKQMDHAPGLQGALNELAIGMFRKQRRQSGEGKAE